MCNDIKCDSCGSENIRHFDDGSIEHDDGTVTEYCDVECQDCKEWN